ncbi:MAG: ABC transporter ATP-binding protein [Candidatus Moranbacteria bacterium]|nr:ABC transporter ATP-binding protein [Candidatus Moranbacteria bacterium]
MQQKEAIRIENLHKAFRVGEQTLPVLRGLDFSIHCGDFFVILGPSGCGKSTLLHSLIGLEEPTEGRISFFGDNLYEGKNEDDRAVMRKQMVGMVYQQPNWIRSLNVIENVAFPLILLGREKEDALEKAHEVLGDVGMQNWAYHRPTELSSGQQQRVALSRALIHNPEVIIADEPTGNLDYQSGKAVMELLSHINKTKGQMIVMVTHDLEYLPYAKRILSMFDGKIVRIYEENEKEEIVNHSKYKRTIFS